MWTPDVYQGAPTSVTAFMAAAAKIGAFRRYPARFQRAQPDCSGYWIVPIEILAVLTMFGGNILAVTQDNIKRMLAYSSIAHSGLSDGSGLCARSGLGRRLPSAQVHAAHDAAMSGAIFYLLAYALMTLGSFGVLVWLSNRGNKDYQTITDMKGIWYNDPAGRLHVCSFFMCSLGRYSRHDGLYGQMVRVLCVASGGTDLAGPH